MPGRRGPVAVVPRARDRGGFSGLGFLALGFAGGFLSPLSVELESGSGSPSGFAPIMVLVASGSERGDPDLLLDLDLERDLESSLGSWVTARFTFRSGVAFSGLAARALPLALAGGLDSSS